MTKKLAISLVATVAIALYLARPGSRGQERHNSGSCPLPASWLNTRGAHTAHDATLSAHDQRIAFLRARAQEQPYSWLARESLANALAARARLSGTFSDYIAADQTLASAFTVAPPGSGPFLSRARLNFTLHRLKRVAADLDRVERRRFLDNQTRSLVLGLRGDVKFHTGHYDQALKAYQRAFALHPSPSNGYRLVHYHWKTGSFAQADRKLDQAIATLPAVDRQQRAWFHLQKGLLDLERGRYRAAFEHYVEANRSFDGWYLIEEHMAEISAALGCQDRAIREYRDLVLRTQNPELMAALADILADSEPDRARSWRDMAGQAYQRQFVAIPQAAAGHALEYFLDQGDMERAVELAEFNAHLRPGGDARTLLAHSYALAGRRDEAVATITQVVDSPYRTAHSHALAALLFAAHGAPERAALQRQRAEQIRPDAMEEVAGLISTTFPPNTL